MNNENNMNNLGTNPVPVNNMPENNPLPTPAPVESTVLPTNNQVGNVSDTPAAQPVNEVVAPVSSEPVADVLPTNPAPETVTAPEVASAPETVVAPETSQVLETLEAPKTPEVPEEPKVEENGEKPVENLEETIELNPDMQSMVVENLDETQPLETTNASYDNSSYNEFADQKPKKKGFSPLTVILVLLVLLTAGGGIWYFYIYSNGGSGSKTTQTFKIKDVVIELGNEIPTDITFYATQKLSQSEYTLITNKINNNVVGDYEYTLKYNNKTYTGKASVKDTVAPTLKVNNKMISDVTELSLTDLVNECKDLSTCNYRFKDESVLDTIKGKGTYNVEIVAYDEYGNETIEKSLITVNTDKEYTRIVCTKDIPSSKYKATITDLITVSFDENNSLYRLKEETTYNFENNDELKKYLENNQGDPGTSDNNLNTFYYADIYTPEDLKNSNSKKNIPQAKDAANEFFTNSGYECK